MQDSSPQFDEAMDSPSITWVPPLTRVGWHGQQPGPPNEASSLRWSDDFQRTISDGWGGLWTPQDVASYIDVTPGEATILTPDTEDKQGARFSPELYDLDITTVVSLDSLPTNGYMTFVVEASSSNNTSYVALLASVYPNGQVRVAIDSYRSGGAYWSLTGLNSILVDSLTYTAGMRMGIRFVVGGSTVLAKLWDESGGQPSDWTIMTTDPGPRFPAYVWLGAERGPDNTDSSALFNYHSLDLVDLRILGDLSQQAGESFSIEHRLDDGLPDAVSSSVGGDPSGSLTTPLVGRTVDGVAMNARQYFSPFNKASPVHEFERDIPRVEFDFGAMTSEGPEYIRLFTGQMVNIPFSSDGTATLQAISELRTRLMKAVKAPIIEGRTMGANISAIVSWVLYQCGVKICPWPNPGTRLWIPFHGTARHFIPDVNGYTSYWSRRFTGPGEFQDEQPTFQQGPWLGATTTYEDVNDSNLGTDIFLDGIALAPGAPLLSNAGSEARVEAWIKGDPSPIGDGGGSLFRFAIISRVHNAGVSMRVANNRELRMTFDGGSAGFGDDRVFASGLFVPTDGEWHSCGWYYNIAGNRIIMRLDGLEVVHTPAPAFITSNLPDQDDLYKPSVGFPGPTMVTEIPTSDVMLTSGSRYADPDTNPWADGIVRTEGPLVVPIEDFADTTYQFPVSGTWGRVPNWGSTGEWSLAAQPEVLLNTNPNFETDASDWTGLGTGATVVRSTVRAYTGTASGLLTTGSGATPSARTGLRPGAEGRRYKMLAWVYSVEGFSGVQAALNFFDGASSEISTFIGTSTPIPAGVWTRVQVETEAPDNTVQVAGRVRINGSPPVGTQFWFDAAELYQTSIGHDETSTAVFTVPDGAREVSFLYWLESESGYDFFEIDIAGETVRQDSGVKPVWVPVTFPVPEGTSTISLEFNRDVTAGAGRNNVWVKDVQWRESATISRTWESEAVIRFIEVDLEAVYDTRAQEGWKYLSDIAQSSLTAMRIDEHDRLNMLTPSYFAEHDLMNEVGVISTELNAEDPDVTLDPTKIRNSVQVDFKEVRVDTSWTYVLAVTTSFDIGPRATVRMTFPFDRPAVFVDESITTEEDDTPIVTGATSRVFANTQENGEGTYLNSSQFTARVIEWDAGSITVEFSNRTNNRVFVANDISENYPFFGIAGRGVSEADASATVSERQQRGERTLTVSAPIMQRREEARKLAGTILSLTRKARAEVTVRLMGDPRRTPGDLVSLRDPEGTQIMGSWRVVGVAHNKRGAEYIQTVDLRQVQPVALWDDETTGWDEGVWSI